MPKETAVYPNRVSLPDRPQELVVRAQRIVENYLRRMALIWRVTSEEASLTGVGPGAEAVLLHTIIDELEGHDA